MAQARRTPRGGDGACLFLKSGSACRRLGSSEATQGGGSRRKEGGVLRPSRSWVSGVARRAAEACRRRGQRGGSPSDRAGRRWLQLCTRGASGGQLLRPAGRREPVRGPPEPGPHRAPAAACAAQPGRVCAATQLARGPPTRARPRLESLPEPSQRPWGTAAAAPASARARNVVTAGTRWRAGLGRRSRAARTWSRRPFSLRRAWALCGRRELCGGRGLGPVLERPKPES